MPSNLSKPSPFGTTNNVLPNPILSESPVSTPQSTPVLDSSVPARHDNTVPPLRLDDIQSSFPLDEPLESSEVSATIAFPQDIVPGSPKVPSVTITTSHSHSMISSPRPNTPPIHTNDVPESSTVIHGTVISLHQSVPEHSASTASSVLTDGDKLTELPASFSAPRLQALSRKAADSSGIPPQDSVVSSVLGQSSRRSGDSEKSSFVSKNRGDVTPKRVSFDGDRPSFSSSLQNVRNAFIPASPPLDGRANEVPLSPSHAKSHSSPARSPSPLRNFLWPLHRSHSREEPFVPVDPYKFNIFLPPQTLRHLFSQIICQLYRHILLRLPSTYFTRVSRVFADAEVSRPEVQRMIDGRNRDETYRWPADHEWVTPNVSPALIRFKESWESFVESVLKEWKTLNVVSALLMTAILTIFQIVGASTTPFIRTTAFLSLICALMSLVYGCMYILRFGTMKSMYRASKWAEEAQRATSIFWNVWVLLAMPAVWIAWSMLFFCISILGFVWEQPFSPISTSPAVTLEDTVASAKSSQPQNALAFSLSQADRAALAPRILISFAFVLGLIYFVLVVRTFRSWGDPIISQDLREGMETGRWIPRSPSLGHNAPASPRLSRESRFDTGDEKLKQIDHERRTRSVDSLSVV